MRRGAVLCLGSLKRHARARGSPQIITEEEMLHGNWLQGSPQVSQAKQRLFIFYVILHVFMVMLSCVLRRPYLKC